MQNGAKILLVDDEEDICYLTKLMLEREGYKVILAKSCKEAMEKAIKEKPDAVLLDIILPDGNGWDVCMELKTRNETKSMPVAMFSVRTDEEERKWGFSYSKCDWYIEKPANREKILKGIRMLLNEKEEQS